MATYQNLADEKYRWTPQKAQINLEHVEQWYIDEKENENELFTYRLGYLKLAPIAITEHNSNQIPIELPTGYIKINISWKKNYQIVKRSKQIYFSFQVSFDFFD